MTPISLGFGTAPDGAAPRRLQGGPGGTLRLLRQSWEHAYLVPLEAGIYLGDGHDTTFVYAAVEAGVTLSRWDLGLAAGAGILAMSYSGACDGNCNVGGAGPLLAPVVRYLILDRGAMTLSALARVVVPLRVPTGDWFGYYTGRGVLALAGVEIAFSAGSRR